MTNWETQTVRTWLSNDENMYYECLELVEDAEDIFELSRLIENYVDENNPISGDMYGELLQDALSAVDWLKVAEDFWEEEEEEEEEE